MKIIKAGHIKPKRVTCYGCGATLEYTQTDVKHVNSIKYITCPLCRRSIKLKEVDK